MTKLKIIPALFILCIMFSCDKYDLARTNPRDTESDNYRATIPVLSTAIATNVKSSSATSGGNVTSDGYAVVTSRGVCWNTSPNPTITNSKIVSGTGTGVFSAALAGLLPNIKYYARAYAINSAGISYGNEISFTTLIDIPTITTTSLSAITSSSAKSGGNITSDGGVSVTARGVCYSATTNPTLTTGSFTSDGTGTGEYISSINSIASGTTYYLKAYATNSTGTAYGSEISFKTLGPVVATTAINGISATTAYSGGNVTADVDSPITARGVCWSTSINPTVELSPKTSNGVGNGAYSSSITGLTANTTYYVKAYVTCSYGTYYGNEVSFSTIVIGATYQGGIVAYILQSGDPGYIENQTHGLIAAPADQVGIAWYNGTNITTGATGTALGTGNANTNSIVAVQGAGSYAARLCYDLVIGIYSDWYLPSKDELSKLYLYRASIGGMTAYAYWSSTESSIDIAWLYNFTLGTVAGNSKFGANGVRAIRAF